MTAAHVTKFLFACVSWLVLALPMQAAAADPCPLLRAQAGSPVVATRLAAAACEEHQLWYRPFIDLDGRPAGSPVREAATGLPANGQPARLPVERNGVVAGKRGAGLVNRGGRRPIKK